MSDKLRMKLAGVNLDEYPAIDHKLARSDDPRDRVALCFAWARERHAIYLRRHVYEDPLPWTNDPYLSNYRFCNVYREVDKVSVWMWQNIIKPFEKHPHLWFMMMLARYINHPETLQDLISDPKAAWPQEGKHDYVWDWRRAAAVLERRKANGEKMVTGAYIVNSVTSGSDPDEIKGNKARVIMYRMSKAWERRSELSPKFRGSMQEAVESFMSVSGFGPFLAYQAAVDLSYSSLWLKNAEDINLFNSAGPGTRRGVNRLFSGSKRGEVKLSQEELTARLQHLLKAARMEKYWPQTKCTDPSKGWAPISMSNLSNCMCEVDKFFRLILGEGEPRSRYSGNSMTKSGQKTLF